MRKELKKVEVELRKLKVAVKRLGHIPKYVNGGGFSDGIECSCGWKNNQYWDLVEAASDEWVKHAKKILVAGQARLDF